MGKKSGGVALRRIMDGVTAPVYALDTKRRIAYCNPAFVQWTGRSLDDFGDVRCDYHSVVADGLPTDSVAELASSLCPPPTAFSGATVTGRIIVESAPGELSEREAKFVPLPTTAAPQQEACGVLVIVSESEWSEQKSVELAEPETLHTAIREHRRRERHLYKQDRLLGVSPAIQRVRRQINQLVDSNANVQIIGPPGSGREHVARTVYYGSGAHERGMLIPLSCEILDAELLESTVSAIGHEPDGLEDLNERSEPAALLLLDVDALSASGQAALAVWLEQGASNRIRMIGCSRESLIDLAHAGQFHRELAYALCTNEICLPALAERPEDIPLLAQAFMEE